MGVTSTIAITTAAIANANAAAAQTAAREAQAVACRGYVQQFQAQGATVEAQQQYASCVQLLHPQAGSAGTPMEVVIGAKVAILLAFLGLAIGAWAGWREDRDAPMAVASGMFGMIALPACVGLVGLMGYGLYWVFA